MVQTDIYAVLIIAATVVGFILYIRKNKDQAIAKIRAFLLNITLEAERVYGEKTGQAKKAYVIDVILNSRFYNSLPFIAKLLITEKVLGNVIDKFVGETFNSLKNGEYLAKWLER